MNKVKQTKNLLICVNLYAYDDDDCSLSKKMALIMDFIHYLTRETCFETKNVDDSCNMVTLLPETSVKRNKLWQYIYTEAKKRDISDGNRTV